MARILITHLELSWKIDFVQGFYSYSRNQLYHQIGVTTVQSKGIQEDLNDKILAPDVLKLASSAASTP